MDVLVLLERPDWMQRRRVLDLAADIGLDMARWWCATRVSFFDHVTKDTILEAISEGASKQAANNVVNLKKGAIAARAETLLENTQWLPEPLRTKLAS